MPTRRDPGGAFRPLWPWEHALYAAHLLRLSPEDRRSRFLQPASDATIRAHAARALSGPGRVIGWFDGGALRAASEVSLSRDGRAAEAAFEVETAFRGRGVGGELVARALLWSRNRGARRVHIHTTRANLPMLRAATRRGARFEFDLTEAEGVIEAPRPDWPSHLREARLAALDAWAGLLDGARRRAPRPPLGAGVGAGPKPAGRP